MIYFSYLHVQNVFCQNDDDKGETCLQIQMLKSFAKGNRTQFLAEIDESFHETLGSKSPKWVTK